MKSIVCGLVLFAGAAASANASVVLQGSSAPLARTLQAVEATDTGGLRTVNSNYDNWTNPSSGLLGLFKTGGNEIADDLNMVNWGAGAGLLDDMGVNVANTSATGGPNLTGGAGAIRFYRQSDGGYIGGFGFNLPALSLAPGASTRLSFGPGALAGLGFFLTQNIYCSIQYTSVTGIPLADVGMQLRGPINLGTSTDLLINVTGATNLTSLDFGGVLANTGLKISTNDVPAPGALALLGLGGVIAGRRRR